MYKMAKPKVPKAKKPKAKPKRKNPVAQKQKQRQNVNVRVINNNGGAGGGVRSEGVRTVPITTYPLFREQFDVAPITLNRNSLPDTSAAPPPPPAAAAAPVVIPRARVAVPPTIPISTPARPERAPFTSPGRGEANSPSGELNFRNIYRRGDSDFKYVARERSSSKKAMTESEKEDDQPILNARQTEAREKAVRIRKPLTDAERERKNAGDRARRLAKKQKEG